MSTSSMNLTADLTVEKFTLGSRASTWVGKLVMVGIVTLAIAAALGLNGDAADKSRFLHSYMTAYMYVASIAIGGMMFVLIMNVTSAGWSATVRRIAELVTMSFPMLGVLAIPMVVAALTGQEELFPWSDYHVPDPDSPGHFLPSDSIVLKDIGIIIHAKAGYFGKTFFTIRMAFYFVVWIAMSRWALNTSKAQDVSGDPLLTNKLKKHCAPMIPLMALTLTFFSLDMLMALDPTWYSTIFGVYYFAGGFGCFLALLGILTFKLGGKGGILEGHIRDEHYHDIGKLTFAFVMFWGYIAFSQYILIWYANIPEETVWYKEREHYFWGQVAILFVLKFLVPFLGLMSRHIKRNPSRMVIVGGWMLLMHLYDMFFLVAPSHVTTLGYLEKAGQIGPDVAESFMRMPIGMFEILCTIGIISLFAASIARAFATNSILAIRDPRMTESMTFHNP